MVKDHFTCLKHGIDFLYRLLSLSRNEDLCHRIKHLVPVVKDKLDKHIYERQKYTNSNSIMHEDHECTHLREEMKNVVIKPGTDEYEVLFPELFVSMTDFVTTNDFLLGKIKKLMDDDLSAPGMEEIKDLRKMLTSLKPLYTYLGGIQFQFKKDTEENQVFTTPIAVLDCAMRLLYLCFIGEMDEEMAGSVKKISSILLKETDVEEMYLITLKAGSSETLLSSDRDLYLLDNLLMLLARNSSSLNFAYYKLYGELYNIKDFIAGLEENVRLKKLHFLQASFEAILSQAIPMLCLCYEENLEGDMIRKSNKVLSDVLDQIKLIKSETKAIKLYHYPRTDGLGFLKFFSRYLLELMEIEGISTFKNEIERLHFEIFSLTYLFKVTRQNKLAEATWTRVIHLAYQAEYVIDLYLVCPARGSELLSSLSDAIEQLKHTGEELHSLLGRSLQPQDVENSSQICSTATQVYSNDVFVGFLKETSIIMEFLLGGEKEVDIISVAGMAGVGKTTIAFNVYKTSSAAMSFMG